MPFSTSSMLPSFDIVILKCPIQIKLLSNTIPSIKHTREDSETKGGSLSTDLVFPTNTVGTRGCNLRAGGGGKGKKTGFGVLLLPFSSSPLLFRLQDKRVS